MSPKHILKITTITSFFVLVFPYHLVFLLHNQVETLLHNQVEILIGWQPGISGDHRLGGQAELRPSKGAGAALCVFPLTDAPACSRAGLW